MKKIALAEKRTENIARFTPSVVFFLEMLDLKTMGSSLSLSTSLSKEPKVQDFLSVDCTTPK